MLADLITDSVIEAVLANPEVEFWTDCLAWVEEPIRQRTNQSCPCLSAEVAMRLESEFAGVQAFHGCRTADPSTYYRHGIQPLNPGEANNAFRLMAASWPGVAPDDIERAILECEEFTHDRSQKAFVVLDARLLVEQAGHYLLYGSEYICALAAALGGTGGPDYRQLLKSIGKPTVIECSIPWESVPPKIRLELASTIVCCCFSTIGGTTQYDYPLNFGFGVLGGVPPCCLLRHQHPQRVLDPLLPRN